MDISQALEFAEAGAPKGLLPDDENVIEIENGWFFPWKVLGDDEMWGSNGVIINKVSGACFHLGSAYPVERDLAAYSAGYTRTAYDLCITNIVDLEKTVDLLDTIRITIIEPETAHGTIWRIPRQITRSELRDRLDDLPQIFTDVHIYFHIEALEEARMSGVCDIELIEPSAPVAA